MINSQLTVSAIRQQFESINYPETADTRSTTPKYAVALKRETHEVTQKKQPPKTRPKPKLSAAAARQSGDSAQSADDVARLDQSAASVPARRQGRSANDHSTRDAFPLTSYLGSASNPTLTTPAETETRSSSVPKQPQRISRDEMDIVCSVKQSVPSRSTSTCSLLSDFAPSYTNDVKEAIKKAKQKTVLQRIVGMKLEGESLSYDVNTHGKMNELPPTLVSSDASPHATASTNTNHEATSATVNSEPCAMLDSRGTNAVIERSNSNPTYRTLPSADKTAIQNEERSSAVTESLSKVVTTHAGVQTRRPTSLYPQDIQQSAPETQPSVTSELVSTDNWTVAMPSAAGPPSLPRLRNAPSTENTPNVTSAKHPPVATSRKSYLALTTFVRENFSFLDELGDTEEDTRQSSGDSDSRDADVEQTAVAALPSASTTSTDQASSDTATGHCTQDLSDDKQQTTETTIVLPNGEIA